tara:strand:+ start:991 stop:3375 length:2385 start_codon:yes stop_codon:yes gene_type:complete
MRDVALFRSTVVTPPFLNPPQKQAFSNRTVAEWVNVDPAGDRAIDLEHHVRQLVLKSCADGGRDAANKESMAAGVQHALELRTIAYNALQTRLYDMQLYGDLFVNGYQEAEVSWLVTKKEDREGAAQELLDAFFDILFADWPRPVARRCFFEHPQCGTLTDLARWRELETIDAHACALWDSKIAFVRDRAVVHNASDAAKYVKLACMTIGHALRVRLPMWHARAARPEASWHLLPEAERPDAVFAGLFYPHLCYMAVRSLRGRLLRLSNTVRLIHASGAGDAGAGPEQGNTAVNAQVQELLHAYSTKDTRTVKNLLKKHTTPLLSAIEKEDEAAVRQLLEAGESVNEPRKLPMADTPLMSAVINGNADLVRLLVEKRANVHATDIMGTTALMKTGTTNLVAPCNAERDAGQAEIVDVLLAAGVCVNAHNIDGMTALMIASQNGCIQTVLRLLEGGAYVDARAADGSTALTLAKKFDHVVQALVYAGTSLDDAVAPDLDLQPVVTALFDLHDEPETANYLTVHLRGAAHAGWGWACLRVANTDKTLDADMRRVLIHRGREYLAKARARGRVCPPAYSAAARDAATGAREEARASLESDEDASHERAREAVRKRVNEQRAEREQELVVRHANKLQQRARVYAEQVAARAAETRRLAVARSDVARHAAAVRVGAADVREERDARTAAAAFADGFVNAELARLESVYLAIHTAPAPAAVPVAAPAAAPATEYRQHECVVCLEDLNNDNIRVVRPCGHACLCADCANALQPEGANGSERWCPMCRVPITGIDTSAQPAS